MISKYIIYNGVRSSELGLRLVDDITFESPEKDVELINIDGVNGSKIRSKQRLNVISKTFPFKVYNFNVDIQDIIGKLNVTYLNQEDKWHDFELSWDPDYIYKAYCYETFSIEGSLKARKKCVINFKVHPVKFRKNGFRKFVFMRTGDYLVNPEKREAKPLIKLVGSGDVTLNINSQIFRLKGVQGHIIIDCESQSASWDNKEAQYDKVYSYPFPKLELGKNLINWDNSNFRVEITPRWEANV
ncbi:MULTISPECIES: hypothetical protein [unclassified Gemella]|uniref:hypothetical protein n=1 Tax=unclassified Gemella TaxID=2624949 RepID=UPI0015CFD607|nr:MULTISPECIES: hypothetical protein [unclassified Gemella]MBF0709721.1 hypothetical protein [Gemella sp. GL1.1]NYS27065.1 hypothetical protein [Gemella sp. GL1]